MEILIIIYFLIGLAIFINFFTKDSLEYEIGINTKFLEEFGRKPYRFELCLMYAFTFIYCVFFWGPQITYNIIKKIGKRKNA